MARAGVHALQALDVDARGRLTFGEFEPKPGLEGGDHGG